MLAAEPGIIVLRTSRVWETDPVGGPPQPDFLNIVVEIDTTSIRWTSSPPSTASNRSSGVSEMFAGALAPSTSTSC